MSGLWVAAWTDEWDPKPLPLPPGPSDLATLVREGAKVVCRCDIYGQGTKVDEVPVIDGNVTYDASNAVLRTCDVTVLGPTPTGPSSLLAPAGAHFQLWRGAVDWTGQELLEPAGMYGFEESEVERDGGGAVALSGFDYSRTVSDNRWREPYEIASGTNLVDAISAALESRMPTALWQPIAAPSSSFTTPTVVWGEERDNDPWDDLQKLAASAGMVLFFDRRGRPTLTPIPDPDTAPVVWDYTASSEPTYLGGARRLVGRPYNVVVARGEAADDEEPVTWTEQDDDPDSASFVGFYERPFFMTSGYISTEAQARDAALGELNRRKGLAELVTIQSVPHPQFDVGDVVRAVDPQLAVDARYVIDRLTIPLRPGRMTLSTRRRRL